MASTIASTSRSWASRKLNSWMAVNLFASNRTDAYSCEFCIVVASWPAKPVARPSSLTVHGCGRRWTTTSRPSISPGTRQGMPANPTISSFSASDLISSAIAFEVSSSGIATSGLSGQRCMIDCSGVITLWSSASRKSRGIERLAVRTSEWSGSSRQNATPSAARTSSTPASTSSKRRERAALSVLLSRSSTSVGAPPPIDRTICGTGSANGRPDARSELRLSMGWHCALCAQASSATDLSSPDRGGPGAESRPAWLR